MPTIEPAEIDRLLETLTGVVRARVRQADGGRLSEIHVLSDGAAPPKQIVRNIETALKTAFDLSIDHRVVSIAVLKEEVDPGDLAGVVRGNGSTRSSGGHTGSSGGNALGEDGGGTKSPPGAPRVVFRRLRVVQEEPLKVTAYVELELDDVIFEGSHRDTDTPRSRVYSSAKAVIEALEYLAEKEMAFYLAGLESLNAFQQDVLVVLVEGRQNRDQRRMLGTAIVGEDPQEAAVRAVLDAVNRFISRPGGGMPRSA